MAALGGAALPALTGRGNLRFLLPGRASGPGQARLNCPWPDSGRLDQTRSVDERSDRPERRAQMNQPMRPFRTRIILYELSTPGNHESQNAVICRRLALDEINLTSTPD